MRRYVVFLSFQIPEAITLTDARDGVPATKVCALCKRPKPGYVTWAGQYVCGDDIADILRVRKVKRFSRAIFRGEALEQPEREAMTDRPKFDPAFWGRWV